MLHNSTLWKLSAALGATVLFASCDKQPVSPEADATVAGSEMRSTEMPAQLASGNLIPNQYIVVLKDTKATEQARKASYADAQVVARAVAQPVLEQYRIAPTSVQQYYGSALQGFAAQLTAEQLTALRQDERVAYVEQDQVISVGTPQPKAEVEPEAQTTPYGVTRVGSASGEGLTAWVIDTGIDLDHPDLTVDQARSRSFVSGVSSADDGNGHGTHVAGTIAANDNGIGVVGVAAGATVVAVRVLGSNGSGTNAGVIAGVDYVGANASAGEVANMSLGGGVSAALDQAVTNAANRGILFALAAGNSSTNATNSSPARTNGDNIFTISAMNSSDSWASFSNFGNPPVDYCMPGASVRSTYRGGGYSTLSGTSMAAPHMAGVLLLRGTNFGTSGSVRNDPDGNADPIASL